MWWFAFAVVGCGSDDFPGPTEMCSHMLGESLDTCTQVGNDGCITVVCFSAAPPSDDPNCSSAAPDPVRATRGAVDEMAGLCEDVYGENRWNELDCGDGTLGVGCEPDPARR